jgi:hypothetical protein
MAQKKKKNWLAGEIGYLLLAPFLVLLGILIYGVLFDMWFKDPILVLKASLTAYGVIILLRLLEWMLRSFRQ